MRAPKGRTLSGWAVTVSPRASPSFLIRRPDATVRVVYPSTFTNIRHRPQLVFTDAVSTRDMHSCPLHVHHPTSLAVITRGVLKDPRPRCAAGPAGGLWAYDSYPLRRAATSAKSLTPFRYLGCSYLAPFPARLRSICGHLRLFSPPPRPASLPPYLITSSLLLPNEHFATLQLPKPLHIFISSSRLELHVGEIN